MIHNWTYITQHFVEWSTQGYETALGFFFWPLVFTGVIGYVYLKNQSLVAAAAVILILFAAFFNAIALMVQPWINFLYIAVSLIITGVIFGLFYKFKNRGSY